MIKSIIDLHLSSTYHPNERYYRLAHCQMVAWLIENFKQIKSGEVDYHQYERKANSLGIATYREEAFEIFKHLKCYDEEIKSQDFEFFTGPKR